MRKIATLDFETDPFKFGRVPTPFACGFFDGENYFQTWGDDCADTMVSYLLGLRDKYLIYAHNGGKFDFCFLEKHLANPLQFINTRLVKARLGQHELRDSYAIIPEPMKALQKDEIDYDIFEYGVRDIPQNKKLISEYLKSDCIYLHGFVTRFVETFGLNLTIAGTSLKRSKYHHPFDTITRETDAMLRPFYFGGRVECFEKGSFHLPLKYLDINSSYPDAMRRLMHPIGRHFAALKRRPNNGKPYFAHIVADSDGALPERGDNGGLRFPRVKNHEFFACSHEIETGEELGLIRVRQIKKIYATTKCTRFDTFIDECMKGKIAASESCDKVMRTFWKLLANSSYGKYAQDSSKYRDAMLFDHRKHLVEFNVALLAENPDTDPWELECEYGSRVLASRPAQRGMIYNVATAASITSGARSNLLRALAKADRPLYCDTDSIICLGADVEMHPTKIGAWDVEAELDELHVAGKKLYAGFYKGECIKLAAKGIDLKGNMQEGGQIVRKIAQGFSYVNHRQSPSMKVFSEAKFISRTIRLLS
jgi:hypothetical protein